MYPGVDPTESVVQEGDSVGVALKSSQQMHEDALRNPDPIPEELKQAISKAIEDEFAVGDAWSSDRELKFVIKCPSGQKCLAKPLNTLDLIDADLLDEIDFFQKKLMMQSGEDEGESANISKIMKDPVKKKRLFTLLDGLLSMGVIKPTIKPVPTFVDISDYRNWKGPDLPPGEVWANKVDFQDKMFIFNELNKPLDEITTFRVE